MHGIRRLMVLVVGLGPLLGEPPLAAQTGVIAGRVTDRVTGRPVAEALIEARAERGFGRTTTNHEGRFRISGVVPGQYATTAAAVGYGTQSGDTVHVPAGGTAIVAIQLVPVPIELNPLVATTSRRAEKALDAPAHVTVVAEREIDDRPALSLADHVRATTGLDVMTGGLQSTRVVARGFNSIFSGNLHTLTDNRIASLPSLRVNLLHMLPQTSDDVQRVEVVLGPGAALYGPNTANGVLHVLTKSPIDHPGSTVSVAGGERSVLHIASRAAVRLSDRFGFKVSGQYFHGHDWPSTDSIEQAARQAAMDDFDTWRTKQPRGLTETDLRRRAGRIAARDFDVVRYSFDARAEWRVTPELSVNLAAGQTTGADGIELTGVGAALIDDWTYGYYQARFNFRRWFAQAYVNASNAGGTFMLNNGAPIVDGSRLWVAQLQHGANWRQLELTYGGDLAVTRPATGGTIHGSHEDNDQYAEIGGYLQAKAAVTTGLDLLLAARWDRHTALDGAVISPRAALVIKPTAAQAFRLTYNRGFSTPTSLDLFIDMDRGPARSLGPLGFRIHAHGAGTTGIRLVDANGWPLGMRAPGRVGLIEVNAASIYDAQLGLLLEQLRANPATAGLVPLLQQLGPAMLPGAAQLPVVALNASTNTITPVVGSVRDIPGLQPSIATVWEVGYRGLIGERLLITADAWRLSESDFTSSLVIRTPLFLLDPDQFGEFLAQNAGPSIVSALVQAGHPEAVARERAQELIAAWVRIPGGVASSEDLAAAGASLVAMNVNFGEVDLWGFDLGARWLITGSWSVSGTYSHVSDHSFCLLRTSTGTGSADCSERDLLALNAPKDKLTAALMYRSPGNAFVSEIRARHTGGFPVSTSEYTGLQCIGGGGEPCVRAFTLLDLLLGYELTALPGASVQLLITNVLDEGYRSFVGVPTVGRLSLLRLRYEF